MDVNTPRMQKSNDFDRYAVAALRRGVVVGQWVDFLELLYR